MKEKEFIEHIKEVMQTHEEPYKDGSWERFAKKPSPIYVKKKRFPYQIAAATIIILLGAGIWIFYNFKNDNLEKITSNKQLNKQENNLLKSNGSDTLDTLDITNNSTKLTENILVKTDNKTFAEKIIQQIFPNEKNNIVNNSPAGENNISINNDISAIEKNKPTEQKNNFSETEKSANPIHQNQHQTNLSAQNIYVQNNSISEQEKFLKKWNIAAQVASSMSNTKKVNMSYGINVGYAFNEKISIHSGASFSQLTSSINSTNSSSTLMNSPVLETNVNDLSSRNAVLVSNNYTNKAQVESSELHLSGVEIPLEMRYNVTKKLYTNVGISAMALIENTQKNIYLQENRQPVGYSIVNETIANDVMIKTEETTSGSDVINDKFIEFFNFSFGYKQPLNSKRNIRVEPFIKVPISNAGIKAPLTNAGVRLGIDL